MPREPHTEMIAAEPSVRIAAPGAVETATFAMGWFWGPDARFGCIDGVLRTRVGYAGGRKKNPTYHDLGDHTESLEIVYDPAMVSYERLLEVFWAEHNPSVPPWSKQYMSILFHHDERQKSAALRSRDRESAGRMRRVFTEILPAREFYQAESYHQKYYVRRLPEILRELATLYPSDTDLTASTAAARLNGYLGGCGNLAMLEAALKKLDLSPEASRKLLGHVPGGRHHTILPGK